MRKNIVCCLVFLVSSFSALTAGASDHAIKITDIKLDKYYSPREFTVVFFDSGNTWERLLSKVVIPREFEMEGADFLPLVLNHPHDPTYLKGRVCVMGEWKFISFEAFQQCISVKDECSEGKPCKFSIEKSEATFSFSIAPKESFVQ